MTERVWRQACTVRELALSIQSELHRIDCLARPSADASLILAQTATGMDSVLDSLREAREDLEAVAEGRSDGERPGRGRETGDMLGLARAV